MCLAGGEALLFLACTGQGKRSGSGRPAPCEGEGEKGRKGRRTNELPIDAIVSIGSPKVVEEVAASPCDGVCPVKEGQCDNGGSTGVEETWQLTLLVAWVGLHGTSRAHQCLARLAASGGAASSA